MEIFFKDKETALDTLCLLIFDNITFFIYQIGFYYLHRNAFTTLLFL